MLDGTEGSDQDDFHKVVEAMINDCEDRSARKFYESFPYTSFFTCPSDHCDNDHAQCVPQQNLLDNKGISTIKQRISDCN